ncbi:PA14 domain-containing protein [Fulvivirga ligni]|uniref:PA14 domain-containing protein n=1 Tax=Fulvivirga ligni TaxID=2904246 RepID=UPI001F45F4A8|nr:PA14 domain-containing protein [Fulvivirga ligni]UII24024.1 PA14 domain-containing protein [Fulvivirga ligni]
MIKKCTTYWKSVLLLIFISTIWSIPSMAQISWPEDQLLPSFPAPEQTQDLIILRESSSQWQAEGGDTQHDTGRNDGDGWLCQTGIDAANEYMVISPSYQLFEGPNVAEFRIKVDNITANNDPIATLEVYDVTLGEVIKDSTITRMQFPQAGIYANFTMPFYWDNGGSDLKLRVFWEGTSYTKVDWVSLQQNQSSAEMYLFASLKGVVNKTKPRIFSYEGDAFAEGRYTWLQSLELDYNEIDNNWDLIDKYKEEIDGLIVYDPAQIHTVNLATTLAEDQNAIIASPGLLSKLTSEPYNFPILTDLRGQFNSKLEVYQELYDTYWPNMDHRVLVGLSPNFHKASLREYASALGMAVIWLDPKVSGESELLNDFLASMPDEANYMGWWPEEGPGVERGSLYGISTIASDYATNLTMHSGFDREIRKKPMPVKPELENKIYVAFILSDGDNLQFVEHLMRKLWNNPDRGRVPIGWTLSPAMVDAMPGALNYYWDSSTENDNLISGPSGYGYTYPNYWTDLEDLQQFAARTDEYNNKAGFNVTTVWNTIVGGISQQSGDAYAEYAPSLLGLTAQNTGGGLTVYKNTLPGMALACNYCTNEQAMKDHINGGSQNWDGNSPRFLIIQAQPWQGVTPTSFKNVANSLGDNYKVVRPDHIFHLIREANGLPIDPINDPVAHVYTDCDYAGDEIPLPIGSYTAAQLQNLGVGSDEISSLKLNTGYEMELYEDDDFGGNSIIVKSDNSCLNSENWDNKATSLKVRGLTGNGDGLVGEYYNGMNFQNYVGSRVDPEINFNWGGGSPMEGVGIDTASIRWTGFIEPHYSETYTFYLTSDNGRRLWVNDSLVIDKWLDDWDITYTGQIALQAGEQYDIKIEYFENYGGANIKFEWSSDSQIRQIVPQSQLYTEETVDPDPEPEPETPTGIESLNQNSFLPYPNPADETLNIKGLKHDAELQIYNRLGASVMQVQGTSVPVGDLMPGLYMLKLTVDGQEFTYRFIKQ